jgi:hypothetical protein
MGCYTEPYTDEEIARSSAKDINKERNDLTVLLCQACQSLERAGQKKSLELEQWWKAHKKSQGHEHPSPDEPITYEHALEYGRQTRKKANVVRLSSRVASAIKVGALGYSSDLKSKELDGVKVVVGQFIEAVEEMNRGY